MAETAGARSKRRAPAAAPAAEPPQFPNGPSDDDIRAYITDLRNVDAQIEVLAAQRKARRKLANGLGIPLGVVDERLKKQLWSPDEIQEDWQWKTRIAELLGQPIGRQLELFGDASTPEAVRDSVRWRARGRMHGLAGIGAAETPPGQCADPQAYGEGWTEGQSETQAAYLRAAGTQGSA